MANFMQQKKPLGATAARQDRLRAANPTRFSGGAKPAASNGSSGLGANGFPIVNYTGQAGSSTMLPKRNGATSARQDRLRAANPTRFPGGKKPAAPVTGGGVQVGNPTTNPNLGTLPGEINDDNGAVMPSNGEVTGITDNNAEAFFPSARAFERENYESSPMFKFQQAEGEKSINRALAKRGLLNSGAELESLSKFNTALGATEADKARGEAQNEADRYERMAQNEATRRERGDERASNDAYRWTQMLLDQNPMKYAADGTDKYASTVGKEANSMANYLSQLYTRKTGGGGGGGGGANTPAPFPSGPDFTGIDTIGAVTGGNNNNSWWNSILSSLPGFFDPKTYA